MTAAAKKVSQLPAPKRQPRKAAAEAQEAEATGDGHVELEHRGVKLRVPVGRKISLAAMDAFRAGDNYEGTKQMLGADQWQRLCDAGTTVEELDEIGERLNELQGN